MKKLIFIQNELKCKKTQFNSFGKYYYRNTESILEALKPLLLKYECLLVITDEVIQIGERYYVKATAAITDNELSVSVSGFAREEDSKKGFDASQITGAASSYARKYALNGLFAIDDTKESDTTNVKEKPELTPQSENWGKVVEYCKTNGMDKVEKKYFLSEETKLKLKTDASI